MTAEGWGVGGGEGGGGGGPAGVAAVRTDAALSAAESSLRSRSEGLSLQVTTQQEACSYSLNLSYICFI